MKKKVGSVVDDENVVNGTYMKSNNNKSKSKLKIEIENYMDRVMETSIPFSPTNNVYDGCPEIKKKSLIF